MWWAGQAQGLIHDIPTCAELVQSIMEQANFLVSSRLPSLLAAPNAAAAS